MPKTLIFAKDDNHAEEIVQQVREVFGKGNDFAAKITYTSRRDGNNPDSLLQDFRTSPTLRVAVTVDMIATGTDVRPLECVFFMRDVKSASYFEQMKGRGARTISDSDFQGVTPDARTKERFVLVDAVGVTEHPFVQATPLNRERSASLQQLLARVANLTMTEYDVATLASRLARLDRQLTAAEQSELAEVAGMPLTEIARRLVDAVDPDVQARALAEAPVVDGVVDSGRAIDELLERAVEPLAANPELRERLVEIRRSHDLTVDEVSPDSLVDAYGVLDQDKARTMVTSWRRYLEEHRDEITALQVLYAQPGQSRVGYRELRELAERISRPPHNWTPEVLWRAYEALDAAKVKHADRHAVTDLVALVRYALEREDELVPYVTTVQERYAHWLAQQEQAGVVFDDRQRWWLDRIVAVVADSAGVTAEDLETKPFSDQGGIDGAIDAFGARIATLLDDLNRELTA